ncbi:MAG: CpaD family pilus assembly lipoprotein [Pseudomonadota bacterium]
MRHFIVIGTCLSALTLGACTMATPTQVSVDRITIDQTVETSVMDRRQITPNVLSRIADDYKKTDETGLRVLVSYPEDISGAKAEANVLARKYSHVLKDKGVNNLDVETVPSGHASYDSRVLVSYKGLKAVAPEDCPRITGISGAESVHDVKSYKIGCEHMRSVSKMVSDPKDLLGRSGARDGDARRAGTVVERYRSGEEFEPLDTTSASGLGE